MLIDQADTPRELFLMVGHGQGAAKYGGHMGVVATGVHDAFIARFIGDVVELFDGEGVDIAPDRHCSVFIRVKVRWSDVGEEARAFRADVDLIAELFEARGDALCSLKLLVAQLREAVKLAAEGDQGLVALLDRLFDAGR